ncbi:unnamed protein product [Staurois parvus]|uniref:Uncharacterized protein n=1 Tax=Staurois parvus TaxID=386267 RepID=A0ABN9AMI6_9NEOB|nr:unnamed protein product [Staurois parvus]
MSVTSVSCQNHSIRGFTAVSSRCYGEIRLNLVKRNVTYSSRREGGLGMVNPVVFFSLMFLKHNFGSMLAERPPAWVGLFRAWFGPFLNSWESGGPVRSLRVKHRNSWVRGLWLPLSMRHWP